MVAPNSRYAHVGESTFSVPDGHVAVYIRRRLLPDPEKVRGGIAATRPGERVDLVAARTVGSVTQFYRLCDANGVSDPFEVAEGGNTQVFLPGQPAIPGVTG